jgi:molybdopterin-containing oxidoreductase family iron-sulfur binding subunit
LAQSQLNRPTKLEGNPDHPASLGATDAFAQASILTLYDPDRAKEVTHEGEASSWEDFLNDLKPRLEQQRASGGAGLRILTETVTSPTLFVEPIYRFDQADAILSLDADFFAISPGRVRYARDFADGRRVDGPENRNRNRLYVVESTPTITGGAADGLAPLPVICKHTRAPVSWLLVITRRPWFTP